jgi:hypothetical protein
MEPLRGTPLFDPSTGPEQHNSQFRTYLSSRTMIHFGVNHINSSRLASWQTGRAQSHVSSTPHREDRIRHFDAWLPRYSAVPPSTLRRLVIELFQFTKICRCPKLTIAFSGATIYVSFCMTVRPYPELLSMKSNYNPLFASSSYPLY